MSAHTAPFTKRLRKHLDEAGFAKLTFEDASAIQKAFVAALKEEVEARFGNAEAMKTPFALIGKPLVIAGLGSFKMKTRPARTFELLHGDRGPFTKPPARRLAFTAKWEEIK